MTLKWAHKLNSIRWQVQSRLIVWRLGNDVTVWLDSYWKGTAGSGFGLVSSAIECSINLFGNVLTSSAHRPWISIVWVATTLANLLRAGFTTVGQWHAECFLLWRKRNWWFRDHATGSAILNASTIHGSWTTDWHNYRCRLIWNWSIIRWLWLRLIRPLERFLSRWHVRFLSGSRLSWNDSWRLCAGRCIWAGSGSWGSGECLLIVRRRWVVLGQAWQILIARLSHDVSFFGQNLGSRFSGRHGVVLIKWSASSLREATAYFRRVTASRL